MLKIILKPFDLVIIFTACAVIGIITFNVYSTDGKPAVVNVKSESGLSLYPLDQDQHLEVEGALGVTVIDITHNQVKVISSPCKDKLCVIAGVLEKNGDWTACMPNRIYVGIKGGVEEGLDEISY